MVVSITIEIQARLIVQIPAFGRLRPEGCASSRPVWVPGHGGLQDVTLLKVGRSERNSMPLG